MRPLHQHKTKTTWKTSSFPPPGIENNWKERQETIIGNKDINIAEQVKRQEILKMTTMNYIENNNFLRGPNNKKRRDRRK